MLRFLMSWFGGPSVNVDGTPMVGSIDVLGRPYGVVEPHADPGLGEAGGHPGFEASALGEPLGMTCFDPFEGGLGSAGQGFGSISPFGDSCGFSATDPFDAGGGSGMDFGGGFHGD